MTHYFVGELIIEEPFFSKPISKPLTKYAAEKKNSRLEEGKYLMWNFH